MIDWTVCLEGFSIGLYVAAVPCLLNYIISAVFHIMKG